MEIRFSFFMVTHLVTVGNMEITEKKTEIGGQEATCDLSPMMNV